MRTTTVSMADVARVAGVSQQTVSRVVNGAENVSEKTRERVLKAIDDLGFRPNFAGRTLRSGRYQSVGLFVYNVTEFGNLATLDGIMSAAREHDYSVTMFEMGDNAPIALEDAARQMINLPVDGLIMSMSIRASDLETFEPIAGLPTVLLTMYEHPLCTTVDNDQYQTAYLATTHLIKKGHKEIRYVAGPDYSVDAEFRAKGYIDAMHEAKLVPTQFFKGDWTADAGYMAGEKLLQDKTATAVFCANDQMAVGLMEAVQNGGKRIPEDISVVGVDDSYRMLLPRLKLTTIRFDQLARGRKAMEHVLLRTRPGYAIQHIRLAGTLIERASVESLL